MHLLTAETAEDAWRRAASLFREGGPAQPQPGRGGDTWELLHVAIEIQDPRSRWVGSRTPAINPAFALVEFFWIAAGRRDAVLPTAWNPRLRDYCGDATELGGAYGYRLRSYFGIDQLDRVYRALDANPNTRQGVLQIWDAEADLPKNDGSPSRADIPCNLFAVPKLRNGRLEWLQVMRSNDLFRGLPYNIVQFTMLQEIMAGWLLVQPGPYNHVSDSLHVYSGDLPGVVAMLASDLGSSAAKQGSLMLGMPRREWDECLQIVMQRLEGLAGTSLSPKDLERFAMAESLPAGYEAAVRIAAADIARRRGWRELSDECAARCDDFALRAAWDRWALRMLQRDARTSRLHVSGETHRGL